MLKFKQIFNLKHTRKCFSLLWIVWTTCISILWVFEENGVTWEPRITRLNHKEVLVWSLSVHFQFPRGVIKERRPKCLWTQPATNQSNKMWPATNQSNTIWPTTNQKNKMWPTTNQNNKIWLITNQSNKIWPKTSQSSKACDVALSDKCAWAQRANLSWWKERWLTSSEWFWAIFVDSLMVFIPRHETGSVRNSDALNPSCVQPISTRHKLFEVTLQSNEGKDLQPIFILG